jgi:hypothetical protein
MRCGLCERERDNDDGVPLCGSCRTTVELGRRAALVGPPEVLRMRAKAMLPRMVLGAVLTAVWGIAGTVATVGSALAWPAWRDTIVVSGSVTLVAGILALAFGQLLYDRGRLMHMGHDIWRDQLIDKLGLAGLIEATGADVHFGMHVGDGGVLALVPRMDAAVLLAWPRGVAVFGAHGSRSVFRRDQVLDAGVRRLWWVWPPRLVWEVEHADGPLRFITADGPTFAANRARLRELAHGTGAHQG